MDVIIFRSPSQPISAGYRIQDYHQIEMFKEGLYLASKDLYNALERQYESKNQKEILSLLKYQIRSSTRCTPFGTFAGCGLLKLSDTTSVVIEQASNHKKNVRMDMDCVFAMCKSISTNIEIKRQLKYYSNNTIYETNEGYRYIEYENRNNRRYYNISKIDKNDLVDKILDLSRSGITIPALEILVKAETDADAISISHYIEDLIDSQIIISELEPSLTGDDPLTVLIKKLLTIHGANFFIDRLTQVSHLLKNSPDISSYLEIEKIVNEILSESSPQRNLFQLDLFINTNESRIDKKIISEILSQAKDLKKIAKSTKNSELQSFKVRFRNKYEDSSVPLVLALDSDLGIGYAGLYEDSSGENNIINDLFVVDSTSSWMELDYLADFILKKYSDCIQRNEKIILLTEEELNHIPRPNEFYDFPMSQYIIGSLFKNKAKLNQQEFTFDLKGFGGPSAANLLGRFAYADNDLLSYVRNLASFEEENDPDTIYAEIVHLPQTRTGNILFRPIIRRYEIPYAGVSGVDVNNQILVDDLMVKVQNDEVVLFSKRLNKRVIPRLTTAHNYSVGSLPVYKFLCDIQSQNIMYPNSWDWGQLEKMVFLPRVVYKNLIIKKARWRLSKSDIVDLPEKEKEYLEYFQSFRNKLDLPTKVLLKENDNELLIDLDSILGIKLLISYFKRKEELVVEEYLNTEEDAIVFDALGKAYANEIIIPFIEKRMLPSVDINTKISSDIQRKYPPFSEWLYFKVYCGNATAENILKSKILSFIEHGITTKLFEKFFFVRYYDDSSHFRIRFFNAETYKQHNLYILFFQLMEEDIKENIVSKIVIDTYVREIERYDERFIHAVESVFYYDSIAVLQLINLLGQVENPGKYRILLALRGIDMLLSDFNFSIEQKRIVLKKLQSNYFSEFGSAPFLQKQLNQKYRSFQSDIFSHLDPTLDKKNEIEEAVEILVSRSNSTAQIINRMFDDYKKDESLEISLKLTPSIVHMFMNRLFISQQRKYELLVYHFLEKYYTSRAAIIQTSSISKVDEREINS